MPLGEVGHSLCCGITARASGEIKEGAEDALGDCCVDGKDRAGGVVLGQSMAAGEDSRAYCFSGDFGQFTAGRRCL